MFTKAHSQELNYISTGTGVYRFDLSDCSTQLVSEFGGLIDAAITPLGNLFAVDNYNLYRVDVNNGNVTFIAQINSGGDIFNSLSALDDEWLIAIRANSELYKINTLTGATIYVGTLGFFPSGDITMWKGLYYFVDVSNQLVKFKFNPSTNQISEINPVGTMNTPLGTVYGVVTIGKAACNSDSPRMVAFEFTNAYEVNPLTANCTPVCDPLIMGSITGAASSAEVHNQMFDMNVSLPNVFTPNADGANDFFEPLNSIEGVAECTLYVLNRWGEIVYLYDNTNFHWDGTTLSGNDCTDGVYFYKIALKDYCENESELTGFIQLVR